MIGTTMNRKRALPSLSEHEVQAKTGKTLEEWFKFLDGHGARKKTHKEIVALLASRHLLPRWWQQRITVAYEGARGLQVARSTGRAKATAG